MASPVVDLVVHLNGCSREEALALVAKRLTSC